MFSPKLKVRRGSSEEEEEFELLSSCRVYWELQEIVQ
jgi:hypothetical protein